ncbi:MULTISPECIES: respiratory nitrate reductase subunit gamma [Nocardia]|uniref:respiratory nitrate reductase subunit gamma n=1 Tax=Nocardia TaxID=1817 RepID=UPI000D6899E8|nr:MULTISPECIES: respiratory nitrate reductase subunit gamma [Nocardia]
MLPQLWIILPYTAFASFVIGHLWQYRRDRFRAFTAAPDTDHVQGLGRAGFRTGFALVIAARVIDLLTSGPDNHPVGGLFVALVVVECAGVVAASAGAVLLFLPDLIAAPPRESVTPLDRITLPALAAGLFSGIIVRFDPNSTGDRYRTAETLFAWVRSLFTLHPQTESIRDAPFIYQARGLILLLIVGIWPYTRLSGMFAGPVVRWIRRNPRPARAGRDDSSPVAEK